MARRTDTHEPVQTVDEDPRPQDTYLAFVVRQVTPVVSVKWLKN